jgi:predicted signal transduction protein with EAL and GGDEF domain
MTAESSDAVVVRSVIDLGHSLGLRTVAEGVEDAATRDMLARLGCDVAQGYLFSRPLGTRQLDAWYESRSAEGAALPSPRTSGDAVPSSATGRPEGPAVPGLVFAGTS